MGNLGKSIGKVAKVVAKPLIGMLPGGGMINSAIDAFGGLSGGQKAAAGIGALGLGLIGKNNKNALFGKQYQIGGIPQDISQGRQALERYLTQNMGGVQYAPTMATGGTIGNVDAPTAAQLGNASLFGGTRLGDAAQYGGASVGAYDQAQAAQLGGVPMFDPAQISQFYTAQAPQLGDVPQVARTFVRGPGGVDIAQIDGVLGTQSADQLANSPFLSNLLGAYHDQFAQNRDLALAQAKEASGNLTGSGYANALGTAVNRSLADENAQMAQIAQQQIVQEQQRQLSEQGTAAGLATAQGNLTQGANNLIAQLMAQRNLQQGDIDAQRALQNAQLQGQYGLTDAQMQQQIALANAQSGNETARLNAQLAQQGGLANQSLAGQYGLQQGSFNQATNLFNAGNSFNAALQNAQFDQQAGLSNRDALNNFLLQQGSFNQQAGLSNQSALNQFMIQQGLFNQQANLQGSEQAQQRAIQQAQLAQQLGLTNAGYANDAGNANSQRLMQLLLGLNTSGITSPQMVNEKGLIGNAAGAIGAIGGALAQRPTDTSGMYLPPSYNPQVNNGSGWQDPFTGYQPSPSLFPSGLNLGGYNPALSATSYINKPTALDFTPRWSLN